MEEVTQNGSMPSQGAPDPPLGSTCFMAAATGLFGQLRQVGGCLMGWSVLPPPLAHPRRPDLRPEIGRDRSLPVWTSPAVPSQARVGSLGKAAVPRSPDDCPGVHLNA